MMLLFFRITQAIFFLVVSLTATITFAQQTDYGKTTFPNSGKPEAQEVFLQGLLMLHSFQYEDARESFQEAQAIDPDFAMAYWGEAMTHNHPVWFRQDRETARAALAKLGKTPEARLAKAATEREKDYLRTLDVLFGDGEKKARDFKYAEAIAKLAAKYPDDLNAAAFHAVALLGTSHDGRDFSIYMKAASVVEEVFAKNPQHPGAAHYLIHSYDDPIHAPLGLRPARVYAKLAPSASHALHMPSHIFFALGMWEEATASNINAYNAAKNRAERKEIPLTGHGFHALSWLLYSNLQQAQYADAGKLLDTVEGHYQSSNIKRRARHTVIRMNATFAYETQRWAHEMNRAGIKESDMGIETASAYFFVQGVAALNKENLPAAKQALAQMKEKADSSEKAKVDRGAEALRLELAALIQLQEGNQETAIDLLKQATAIEDQMPLDFGPPWPMKPSHELFGEVLLELNRPAEAMQQFELALKRTPRRAFSLLGLARAVSRSGDNETAQKIYRELNEIWHNADRELPALNEVRAALGLTHAGSQ
ncbi:MAG: hypothetical protein E2O77_09925 [Caldithrix sp.]|nr:MAG: hypothetical protein E2O77_09925 [Caldithrix sp.]